MKLDVLVAVAVVLLVLLFVARYGSVEEAFSVEGCGHSTREGATKIKKIEEMLDSVVPGLTSRIGICEADRSYTLNKADIRLRVRK